MKFLKIIFAIIIFLLYYMVLCWILGIDFTDPWEKLMQWAKK